MTRDFLEQATAGAAAVLCDPRLGSGFDLLVDVCRYAFGKGGKVLVAGNGGSAAMASHFAAEMVVRFQKSRGGLAALALGMDAAVSTAAGNDLGFEWMFARQVAALGNKDDVLLVLSTSGNSLNVIRAVDAARAKRLRVAGLSGSDGGKLAGLVQPLLLVPSDNVARIQEAHLVILHALAAALD